MKLGTGVFFVNVSIKFQFHWYLTRAIYALHDDQYALLIMSRSVLLKIRNILGKRNKEIIFVDLLSSTNKCTTLRLKLHK